MGTIANVVAGTPNKVTGGVLIAPLGSTLPTDATTTPDVAFVASGFVGEDGLSKTLSRDTDAKKDWSGDTIKILQTDFTQTFQFTFAEAVNVDVLKAVFGDANVNTSGGLSTVNVVSDPLPHKSFVFDVKDGDNRIRIVVPDGQITEVGDVTYASSDIVQYQVTVTAFVSDGKHSHEYIDRSGDES